MNRCITSRGRTALATLAIAAVAVPGSVLAQAVTVDQVLQADQRRLTLAQQSQERVNGIVEETRSLEDQYRAINKEIDGLEVYIRLMEAQTENQRATLDDIALSMDQVDMINRQIVPLMTRMITGLERSIELDIPFLMEERRARVENLEAIMERSDVSVAEKFRKVMEAYQIEMDFGATSEPYEQTLSIEGETRAYNMLRIGRVGLYFQSDDATVTGYWDDFTREWVIDNSARNEVRKGLRMARQLIAPELFIIPVQAPETGPAADVTAGAEAS